MNHFIVVFFNRFANQTQVFEVMAENEFRAGRAFYRRLDRKAYHTCIEHIKKSKFSAQFE